MTTESGRKSEFFSPSLLYKARKKRKKEREKKRERGKLMYKVKTPGRETERGYEKILSQKSSAQKKERVRAFEKILRQNERAERKKCLVRGDYKYIKPN